jgi:hypothetical protein
MLKQRDEAKPNHDTQDRQRHYEYALSDTGSPQYALACSGSHATAAIDKMMLTILGFMVESDAAAIAPSDRPSR